MEDSSTRIAQQKTGMAALALDWPSFTDPGLSPNIKMTKSNLTTNFFVHNQSEWKVTFASVHEPLYLQCSEYVTSAEI